MLQLALRVVQQTCDMIGMVNAAGDETGRGRKEQARKRNKKRDGKTEGGRQEKEKEKGGRKQE